MSKKSWWIVAAALSVSPLAACEEPGARQGEEIEQQQPIGAGGAGAGGAGAGGAGATGTETDPATGTDVGGTETDPTTGAGGGGGTEGGGEM